MGEQLRLVKGAVLSDLKSAKDNVVLNCPIELESAIRLPIVRFHAPDFFEQFV